MGGPLCDRLPPDEPDADDLLGGLLDYVSDKGRRRYPPHEVARLELF